MKVNVTISKNNKVLHSEDYEVCEDGDLERAVSDSMHQARKNSNFGEQWGFSINVSKAI